MELFKFLLTHQTYLTPKIYQTHLTCVTPQVCRECQIHQIPQTPKTSKILQIYNPPKPSKSWATNFGALLHPCSFELRGMLHITKKCILKIFSMVYYMPHSMESCSCNQHVKAQLLYRLAIL